MYKYQQGNRLVLSTQDTIDKAQASGEWLAIEEGGVDCAYNR